MTDDPPGFPSPSLRAAVSSDMEGIFAGSPGLRRTAVPVDRPRPKPRAVRHERPAARRRPPPLASAATLGAVMAAALAGLATGAMVKTGGPPPDGTAAAAPGSAPALAPVVQPEAAPRPQATGSAFASLTPEDLAAGVIPLASASAARPAADEPKAAERAPSAAPKPARKEFVRARPARRPAAPAAKPVERELDPDDCVVSVCSGRQVLVADRRLRDAYREAVASGVSRSDLEYFTDEWSRARKRHAANPGKLVSRYASIEEDLLREAERARDDGRTLKVSAYR